MCKRASNNTASLQPHHLCLDSPVGCVISSTQRAADIVDVVAASDVVDGHDKSDDDSIVHQMTKYRELVMAKYSSNLKVAAPSIGIPALTTSTLQPSSVILWCLFACTYFVGIQHFNLDTFSLYIWCLGAGFLGYFTLLFTHIAVRIE